MEYGHGGDIYGDNRIELDFSVNTNPFGMPESIKQAVLERSDMWSRYPDCRCRALKKKLSLHYNQRFAGEDFFVPEDFICGNGAADLLYSLIYALRPKKALLFQPCFMEYKLALKAGGCEVRDLAGEDEMGFSFKPVLEELLKSEESGNENSPLSEIDMLILGNPNNPTGEALPANLLLRLAKVCKGKNITLVIDECFNWFLKKSEDYTLAPHLEDYPNVFILNAFTKIFGMAGLRLGYGISKNSQLMERIEGCRQPWSVSAVADSAGIQALREWDFVEKTVDFIEKERAFLAENLKSLGFTVYPSSVNYLLFRWDNGDLLRPMMAKGILIRLCGNFPGLGENYYRVAVKLRQENEELLCHLKQVINSDDICSAKEG